MFTKYKKILVVVAHPDDELLGLGSTLNKIVQTQPETTIRVIILGEGITSRGKTREVQHWEQELLEHQKNIEEAKKCIGYHQISRYQFPDNRFDTVALIDIVKVIEAEKNEFKPDLIFTHHGGDVNIDHQKTFEAVITSCRPMQNESVQSIVTFETPSGTEWRASSDPKHFIPNIFSTISRDNLQAKLSAMNCYTYEKRDYPHPRSSQALEILAKRWGIVVGKEMAEAFMLIRCIN